MRQPMVNHQIPIGKYKKTKGKPSDSYEKRWEKMRQPMVNHQIPMGKDKKTYGKPSEFL